MQEKSRNIKAVGVDNTSHSFFEINDVAQTSYF